MRSPQIVVMERDGRLAHLLVGVAAEQRWVLRESRQVEACYRLLQAGGPSVFVLHCAGVTDSELELLARVARGLPDARTVAVGGAEAMPGLAGLVWDLGADFVLFPPLPLTMLADVTVGLMGPVT